MSQKLRLILFLILSAVLISILPSYNLIKNRKLPWSEIQYFNTDIIESLYSLLLFKTFGWSSDINNVVVGKSDFLFLGNRHNRVLAQTQNIYPRYQHFIENWFKNLTELQSRIESLGSSFVIVVVPNKHSVYPEKLPDWAQYNADTISSELIKKSQEQGLNVFSLYDFFQSLKSSKFLYYKTDSHWNHYAAWQGFKFLIQQINQTYQQNIVLPEVKFKEYQVDAQRNASLLKLESHLENDLEKAYSITIDSDKDLCRGTIDPVTFAMGDCTKPEKHHFFSIHKGAEYVMNPNAMNKQKVLFLCDSFSTYNSKIIDSTFQTLWKIHYNKIPKDSLIKFIQENKPDVVVIQMVERALYINYLIEINK